MALATLSHTAWLRLPRRLWERVGVAATEALALRLLLDELDRRCAPFADGLVRPGDRRPDDRRRPR